MEAGTIYQACQGTGEIQRACQVESSFWQVQAASGGSGPTSMATSGKAARRGVKIGFVSWR